MTTPTTSEAALDDDGNVILDPDDYAAMQTKIARLRAALEEIRDDARSTFTQYCQWCGCRDDQSHRADCPADIARATLAFVER